MRVTCSKSLVKAHFVKGWTQDEDLGGSTNSFVRSKKAKNMHFIGWPVILSLEGINKTKHIQSKIYEVPIRDKPGILHLATCYGLEEIASDCEVPAAYEYEELCDKFRVKPREVRRPRQIDVLISAKDNRQRVKSYLVTATPISVKRTIITSDLNWNKNTQSIVKQSDKRMSFLHKASKFTNNSNDLKKIYMLQVRSKLEQSAMLWHFGLTQKNRNQLERVQKSALRVILGKRYTSYKDALKLLNIESLEKKFTLPKVCKELLES